MGTSDNSRQDIDKSILAWAMYDFANSAFATSVLSVIFSVYFASVLVPKEGLHVLGWVIPGESLWGYLISAVMAVVILLSPVLGALADRRALKRFSLVFWATLGGVSTTLLFFATPGRLGFAVIGFFLATLGYEMSLVFYNAFLKDISDDDNTGRVSGLGFAFGYIGGGLCLGINMLMINKPELFGWENTDKTFPIRMGMLFVGVWWLLFSIPALIWLRDKGQAAAGVLSVPCHAFRQLRQTLLDLRRNPQLSRFLLAYLIYDDGIQTVLLMASIFGAKALGMGAGQLALCYLMIQFVAFAGALACGRLADAWSHKKVILSALVLYVGVVAWAIFMRRPAEFWILGVIVGLVMGGGQAASRSFYATLIPSGRSGEFFSLFSIVGKAAALIGPFVFGVVSQFWGLRAGVGSLLIFFIVGGLILYPLRESVENPTENW